MTEIDALIIKDSRVPASYLPVVAVAVVVVAAVAVVAAAAVAVAAVVVAVAERPVAFVNSIPRLVHSVHEPCC